jgi:hypothetical protein
MKSTQRFSVLIWTDKRKTDSQGNVPLYARITYLGKRAEISIGRKLNPQNWDAESCYVKGAGQDAKDLNKHLIEVNNKIHAVFYDLKNTEEFLTAEKIKQKYTGEGPVQRMLLEVFDEHNAAIEKLLEKGSEDYVRATLTKYKTVRRKTYDYIKHRFKKEDVYLETIDYAFVTGLEMYLKTEDGIEHNTAMRYIKNLKKIINLAVNHKWMSHNPFNLFKCTYRKVHRVELEWDEINAIADYNFKVVRLSEVRDTFLFCCYTGYAFIDVEKLTPEHIVTGVDIQDIQCEPVRVKINQSFFNIFKAKAAFGVRAAYSFFIFCCENKCVFLLFQPDGSRVSSVAEIAVLDHIFYQR